MKFRDLLEDVFTARKHSETDEIHLFKGRRKPGTGCQTGANSVCREMNSAEGNAVLFQCEDEVAARIKCAGIGRQMCGTCVSTLYETTRE